MKATRRSESNRSVSYQAQRTGCRGGGGGGSSEGGGGGGGEEGRGGVSGGGGGGPPGDGADGGLGLCFIVIGGRSTEVSGVISTTTSGESSELLSRDISLEAGDDGTASATAPSMSICPPKT